MSKTRHIFLGVFFVLSFGIFKYFPVLNISREIWVVIVFCYLVFVVIPIKSINRTLRFSLFELYVLALMIIMPLHSALMANIEYNQPLYYGVLTQRSIFIASSSLILIYLIRRKRITTKGIEQVLFYLGWLCLLGYLAITLLMNPASFGRVPGFTSGGVIEPHHFIFNSVFVIYIIIFYVNRGLKRKNIQDYFLTLPFFIYLIFIDGGRSLLLSLVAAIWISIALKLSFLRVLIFTPIVILCASIVIGLMYYYQPGYMHKFENKLVAAVTVVLTREKSSDASANARIDEVEMVWPDIVNNLALGNGKLSQQWEGGYLSKVGVFAPSDIGLIGVLYMFGVVGMLVYLLQIIFGIKYYKLIPSENRTTLVEASAVFLIYYFIHSIFTGAFVYDVYISLMFVAIINLSYLESKTFSNKNKNNLVNIGE